jgi:UDP-GlcNAc3NAcA epimerase
MRVSDLKTVRHIQLMYDNTLFFAGLAEMKKAGLLEQLALERDNFILVTIHRDSNTDNIERLSNILVTLKSIAVQKSVTLLMPFHPRTINSLKSKLETLYNEMKRCRYIKIIPPVSFLEMILLEKNCRMVITDSGGVQKESHFFKKPCVVLRKETEWIELVINGTARLVDADPERITEEVTMLFDSHNSLNYPGFYGDGRTAEFILKEIMMMFEKV